MLATVVEVEGGVTIEPGAKCLVRDGKVRAETIGDAQVVEAIVRESATSARSKNRSWFRSRFQRRAQS